MKKIKIIQIIFIGIFSLFPLESKGIMMPPVLPMSPSLDPSGDVALTVEGVGKKVLTGFDNLQQLQEKALRLAKGANLQFPFKLGESIFQKKGDSTWITSSRKIKNSKIADIKDEDSIVEAFHTLFLTYPADVLAEYPNNPEAVKQAYVEKGVEFGNDAMLEMYITVRELEEKLVTLKKEFDELSACYVQGESSNSDLCESASTTDNELGVWTNYYKINSIYDSVLKITEELTVLKAQYEVSQAIQAGIEPSMPEGSEETTGDKVSYNDIMTFRQTQPMAYAQMFASSKSINASADNINLNAQKAEIKAANLSSNQAISSTANADVSTVAVSTSTATPTISAVSTQASTVSAPTTSGVITSSVNNASESSSASSTGTAKKTFGIFELSNNNEAALQPDPNLETVAAKAYEVSSPFAGTADQFQALAASNNAYITLKDAINVHNVKQQLPEYKKPFDEYNKMVKLHEKALEQLMKSEKCAINYLGKYYKDPEEVWLGEGCKYSSSNSIVCDSNRKITADNLKNLLPGDALCANDNTKICSNYGINAYSSREGLSGWLVSAYKVGKAEKALDLTSDDFSTNLSEENTSVGVSDLDAKTEQYKAEQSSGTSDSSFLRPSDEPKVEAQNREEEMLAWQLGAEASKAISNDMQTSAPLWGEIKNTYKLWNDEKYFYDQYLEEKYKNMELFIRDLDLRDIAVQVAQEATELLHESGTLADLTVSLDNIKEYNRQALGNLLPLAEEAVLQPKSESSVSLAAKQTSSAVSGLRSDMLREKNSLNNRKTSVYSDLDSANLELNDTKTEYNTALSNKQDAEANIEYQQQVISLSQERKAKSPDSVSGFESTANSEIKSSDETIAASEEEAESALSQIDSQRDKIDELNSSLSNLNDDISRLESSYAANASLQEYNNDRTMKLALMQREMASDGLSLVNSDFWDKGLDFQSGNKVIKQQYLKAVVDVAESALSSAKEQAISSIKAGKQKIDSLGSAKYTSSGYQNILNIHKETIDSIKNNTVKASVSGILMYMLDAGAISKTAQDLFYQAFIAKVCEEGSCYEADTQYFVGLDPQERDFKAPKSIANSYTPPLREVVHFDSADFDNVIKSDSWMTTKADFLDYGQDVPQIWQDILGSKGFVERDVDISEILSHNEGAADFITGRGEYPCRAGNYNIYVSGGKYYASGNNGSTSLDACGDIQSVNVYLNNKVSVVLKDGSVQNGEYGNPPSTNGTSELAVLLKYNNSGNGGLTFNDTVQSIMRYYEELDGKEESSEEDLDKVKTYDKMLLSRNQLGDYLKFVETEMVYQESVDTLKVKVDELRTSLKEQLSVIDYVPADDFDLSDEATYNEIATALEEGKNKLVTKGYNELKSIQPLNDVLEEKIDKLENMLGSLQTDNEELVQLSDNTKNDSELEENIKSKRADNATKDKYEEEADDAFNDNLNNFEEPYCAVYN